MVGNATGNFAGNAMRNSARNNYRDRVEGKNLFNKAVIGSI